MGSGLLPPKEGKGGTHGNKIDNEVNTGDRTSRQLKGGQRERPLEEDEEGKAKER